MHFCTSGILHFLACLPKPFYDTLSHGPGRGGHLTAIYTCNALFDQNPTRILPRNITWYYLGGDECFKTDVSVNDYVTGDVLTNKSAVGECPRQVNILGYSSNTSKYFDQHHQKVKRKGIAFIIVMSAVIFTIVFMIQIWYK